MTPPEPPVTLSLPGGDDLSSTPSPPGDAAPSEVTARIDEIEHANAFSHTTDQFTIYIGLDEGAGTTPLVSFKTKGEGEGHRPGSSRRRNGGGRLL